MRVLVTNLADNASTNIRDRLLETDDWQEAGRFRGHALYQRAYDIMVQVDGPTIHDEELSQDLQETGWPIHAVWFLSRHRAASGQPSLTVHSIGNFTEAKYGGRPGRLSPSAARDKAALLRRLLHHRDAMGLEHQVTYEATHHGPLMDVPSLFVEIGSDEDWYDDVPSAQTLAAAVTDVLDGDGLGGAPILVGAGGGHYVPRQTTKALSEEADFGHLVPAYALESAGEAALQMAWDATPGAAGVYLHKKGVKGPERQIVRDWCAQRDIPLY